MSSETALATAQWGENKTTTAVVELNLKQVLINTGQDNGYWPGPYPESSENGPKYISQVLTKATPTSYLLPTSIRLGQVCLDLLSVMNLPPTCARTFCAVETQLRLVIIHQ